MTVSDWGSATAPFGARGPRQSFGGASPRTEAARQEDLRRSVNAPAIHPPHGGPEPRGTAQVDAGQMYAQQMYAQTGRMPAGGGVPP